MIWLSAEADAELRKVQKVAAAVRRGSDNDVFMSCSEYYRDLYCL